MKAEREMTAFELSTIRWARLAVFMSLMAAIFVCLQWCEMRRGGADTHDLAEAAKRQADAAKDLAGQAKTQTEKMADLIARTTEQASATNRLADTSQRVFTVSNRPYIGLADWYVSVRPDIQKMDFNAIVKNFGSVPGTDFTMDWDFFIDGVRRPHEPKVHDVPSTMFPGQDKRLIGTFVGPDYEAISSGKKTLDVIVYGSYRGPRGRYTFCGKSHYYPPAKTFFDLGSCQSPN